MTHAKIRGTSIFTVERGEGEPLVLVHGSASDHRTWCGQLEAFASSYRTIAYSRRHHWPNDPIPDGADYSMAEHVDDLAALLGELDAAPAHLVGHSYGAFVALLFAVQRPEAVRALVLAEPPVLTLFVSDPPRPLEIARLALRRPRTAAAILRFGALGASPAAAAARRGDMVAAMRLLGRAILGRRFYRRLPRARLEQVRDNAIAAELLGSGLPPVRDEDVRRLSGPVLLLNGAESPPLFHRVADRLEDLLPRAERRRIRGASHILHEDNPASFNGEVLAFLAEHA